jgi:uncharacterized protein (DUF2252 family)
VKLDLLARVDRQLSLDKARTKRFPSLFARKVERMSASPLAFLRGSAPLFYEIIASTKALAQGPDGEGWIVGDLHLENFGAYRPDVFGEVPAGKKHAATFNLNDFDDTIVGPWRLDVLRLMTSLLLGGRELGATGVLALDLADTLLGAWSRAVFDGAKLPPTPAPVEALLEQVRLRTRQELLDARTELSRGKRRFTRGPRYADLPKAIRAKVPQAFERYIASATDADRPSKGSLEILDAALRIAGTGSLGGLRIAVLVEGKGGPNGAWIFDLKEQGSPSGARLLGAPKGNPAERVVTGFRACLEQPPRVMGTTHLGKISLFGRRLAPQEDKLVLRRIRREDLPALAAYLGALVGHAHRRGAKKRFSRWSKSDRDAVRAQAIQLAGVHEALYLGFCERVRPSVRR